MVAAHRAGVAAAMAYVERRPRTCGRAITARPLSGQSVGVYEQARGLAWIRWDHSTSRAQQPQLHSHVTVLNRAETVVRRGDPGAGQPRVQADQAGRRRDLHPDSQRDARRVERGGVRDPRRTARPREIVGFSPQLLAKASSRSAGRRTARRDELVDAVRAGTTGGPPSPVERKRMHRAAWRETRQAKNHAVAPRQQLANWAAPVRGELDRGGDRGGRPPASGSRGTGTPSSRATPTRDREQVLRAAVRAVQDRYADVGHRQPGRGDRRRAGAHPGGHRGAAGPGGRGAARAATGTGW